MGGYQAIGAKFESYQTAGLPQQLIYNNKLNLGPRLGFAYQAIQGNKPLVLRGAYNILFSGAV